MPRGRPKKAQAPEKKEHPALVPLGDLVLVAKRVTKEKKLHLVHQTNNGALLLHIFRSGTPQQSGAHLLTHESNGEEGSAEAFGEKLGKLLDDALALKPVIE